MSLTLTQQPACPSAGCGGSTLARSDGFHVCSRCRREFDLDGGGPREPARTTHFATWAGSAALVIAAFGFVPGMSPEPVRAASVLTADTMYESVQRGVFPADVPVPGFLGNPERMEETYRQLHRSADGTRSATISSDPILAVWQTLDRQIKTQFLLALKDANDPSFAYTFAGHLLLSGVEHDLGVLEHLVTTLSWLDPGVPHITRYVGEVLLENGPAPQIEACIRDLLL